MKRLDLIINGKGGVGKSFFAVNFVQYLIDKTIPHLAIDTDNENSTLKRFHPGAHYLDMSERRGLDLIFSSLEKGDLTVVDCRAASTDVFLSFFTRIGLPGVLTALGASLTVIMPVNHEADSVDQVQRMADELGKTCGYVIVRNAAHGDNFGIFDASEVRDQIRNKLAGKEVTMAQLENWLVEDLNRENVTITAAAKHAAFGLLDRFRLRIWQQALYREIESAADLLLATK